MRKILSIAWKDTILRFSDKGELLFFLILPVVFTVVLGGVGAGSSQAVVLLLVNEDQTPLAAELVSELTQFDNLDVQEVTAAQAEQLFNDREAPAWLTIPQGFEAAALAGQETPLALHKTPRDTDADAAEQAVRAAASAVNRSLAAARNSLAEAERIRVFGSDAERQAYFAASLTAAQTLFADAPKRVNVTRPQTQTDDRYNQGTQAATGQLVIWVFIPLLGASGLFAFERQQKTLPRLVTTPTGRATFLLGIVVGQVGVALVQMLLLIVFGVYVMKISWGNSPLGLGLMLLVFGLASVAMGMAMGTFIKTEKQASNLSIMFGMVFSMLGGCGWPIELFPPAARTAAQVLPTYWAMQGFNNLAMRGLGFESVLLPAAVLIGFAVVFFVIGVARFRYE